MSNHSLLGLRSLHKRQILFQIIPSKNPDHPPALSPVRVILSSNYIFLRDVSDNLFCKISTHENNIRGVANKNPLLREGLFESA
jgi:hypothetical protein